MIFEQTSLAGLVVVRPERHGDPRGWFARTFCADEFRGAGLPATFVQASTSFNRVAHTLRGMHFQAPPHQEEKLVRCSRGRVFDVAVDLRPASASYGQWYGRELSAENGEALFVPAGLAHGFLTLEAESEVFYMMTTAFAPGHGRGLRWDDPGPAIAWPEEPEVLAERDRDYPDYAW